MLSACEAERQPVWWAADSVSWILRLGGHQRLPGGRLRTPAPARQPACDAPGPVARDGDPGGIPVGVPHTYWLQASAGDVAFWNSFYGRRVMGRSVCWTDGDFAPPIGFGLDRLQASQGCAAWRSARQRPQADFSFLIGPPSPSANQLGALYLTDAVTVIDTATLVAQIQREPRRSAMLECGDSQKVSKER
jgi:hypothetical protein